MFRLPELSRAAALAELAAVVARLERPARVAIDRPDAAGKTILADELAQLLGHGVGRLSADDFLNPAEVRYRRGRESPEGYYQDSVDDDALRAAVQAHPGVLLADGIFLCRPELDDVWDLRIFVAVTEDESLRRGLQRDGAEKEPLYRARYLPGQRLYAESVSPRELADAVLDNEDPRQPRVVWRAGVRSRGA